MALEKLTPGQRFAGDFEVVRLLAEGGMGAVYVVRQQSTGHERALKVMHPQLVLDEANRARFQQEAQVGARIDSDHVVQVVAAGIDAPTGTPWLAMELMRGEELGAMLDRRGALPLDEARRVLDQLGHALTAAHRIGVVHRDLKPENVFVAASRRQDSAFTIKVLDFGISKIVAENRTAATATRAVGSPLWMAPEQTERNGRISPATDVWALGLIAFRALSGRVFWQAAHTESATLESILREMLIDPMEPASQRALRLHAPAAVSPALDPWFARCLERDAARRFPNAGEAMAALESLWPQVQHASLPYVSTTPLPMPPPSYYPPAPVAVVQPTVAWPSAPTQGTPTAPSRVPVAVGIFAGFCVLAVALAAPLLITSWSRDRIARAQIAADERERALRATEEERLNAVQRAQVDDGSPTGSGEYRIRNNNAPLGLTRQQARDAVARQGVFAALNDPDAAVAPAGEGGRRAPGDNLRYRITNAPTVIPHPPEVTGLLSPETVRRVVQRNIGQVNHCYEQGLTSDPRLAGRMIVRFVIGGTGTVMGSSVAEQDLAAPTVGVCVAAAVRRWQFPSPEGGGVVTVIQPFSFAPSAS